MKVKFRSIVLYVKDVKKSIEFYERVFGLKREFMDEDARYAELYADATKISFLKEDFVKKRVIRNGFHVNHIEKMPAGFELAFTADNVEKAFIKAMEEGAHLISKPTKMQGGQIVTYIRDLDGVIIEIANNVNEIK